MDMIHAYVSVRSESLVKNLLSVKPYNSYNVSALRFYPSGLPLSSLLGSLNALFGAHPHPMAHPSVRPLSCHLPAMLMLHAPPTTPHVRRLLHHMRVLMPSASRRRWT